MYINDTIMKKISSRSKIDIPLMFVYPDMDVQGIISWYFYEHGYFPTIEEIHNMCKNYR